MGESEWAEAGPKLSSRHILAVEPKRTPWLKGEQHVELGFQLRCPPDLVARGRQGSLPRRATHPCKASPEGPPEDAACNRRWNPISGRATKSIDPPIDPKNEPSVDPADDAIALAQHMHGDTAAAARARLHGQHRQMHGHNWMRTHRMLGFGASRAQLRPRTAGSSTAPLRSCLLTSARARGQCSWQVHHAGSARG